MGIQDVEVAFVQGALQGQGGLPQDIQPVENRVGYTASLIVLDSLNPLEIFFPINPESDSKDFEQGWSERGAIGQRRAKLDWTGNGAGTHSVRALVEGVTPLDLERKFLKPLELLRDLLVAATQEPPLVILTLGNRQTRGCLTRVSINRLKQDINGDAINAEVNITITENDK